MSGDHVPNNESYILGIDIGTTSVKAALIDINSGSIVKTQSRETKAEVSSEIGPHGNEQDVQRIVTALQICVSSLPKAMQMRVVRIGVSGQMHGIMFWRGRSSWQRNKYGRFDAINISHLFTWQDERCDSDFIASLPSSSSHLQLSSGYGCLTTFWFMKNDPTFFSLNHFSCAGTVQDFTVAMLCDLLKPVMSNQNAASWGYFDTRRNNWDMDTLDSNGFPLQYLPDVRPVGSVAGHLTKEWYSIQPGTPVNIALGDLQCSILSSVQGCQDAVLNLSTSAQLAFPIEFENLDQIDGHDGAIEYFPYFDGRYIAVAASLTGGNALAAFVKMLQQWTHDIGSVGVPESKIWERVLTAGNECRDTTVVIRPNLHGERHTPNSRASVTNVTTSNLSLGNVCRALCRGIISNLHSMMPCKFLVEHGITRIIGNGSALCRNSVMKQELERLYPLPVVYSSETNAAVGAAIAALKSHKPR